MIRHVGISVSFQSYASGLRKKLLQRPPLEKLLDYHAQHQRLLEEFAPGIDVSCLSPSDRFAWKFIREINLLKPDSEIASHLPAADPSFLEVTTGGKPSDLLNGKRQRYIGIHQNLADVVNQVQSIWFPEMENLPKICWLKHFSTRKLAHYATNKDEIAFSLIFDFLEVPAEILSYLAYHELLHRQLGIQQMNKRRYAHTMEFKSQEHLFPNWRDIDKKISDYILKTS